MSIASLLDRLDLKEAGAGNAQGGSRMLAFGGVAVSMSWTKTPALPALDDDAALAGASRAIPAGLTFALDLPQLQRSDGLQRFQAAQRLAALAAVVGAAFAASRMLWTPAQLWSPVAMLGDAVAALERQGLPPVLHLVAMRRLMTAEGPLSSMQTRGLNWFCGSELRIDHPEAMSDADVVKRLARLCIHAMVAGPLEPGAAVPGLDRGEMLIAGPWASDAGGGPVLPLRLRQGR